MSNHTATWLGEQRMYRELRKIAKSWARYNDHTGSENLGLVLYEVWSAVSQMQPFPSVCVLRRDDLPVGVLCGFVWSHERNFYIQHLVVGPGEQAVSKLGARAADDSGNQDDTVRRAEIQKKLLEAAIDYSQHIGFHGWVSCAPDNEDTPLWRKHGFSLHRDGMTYRRMGYFTQLS